MEASNPFAPSPVENRKAVTESVVKWSMLGMAILLIVPVFAILFQLFYKAWPVLSLNYLWDSPKNLGREGGIWLPLIGTFYL
ncbi:MAG: phosphate ABC transporter permease PstA, partial [Verrucomicrobiales bacterium]